MILSKKRLEVIGEGLQFLNLRYSKKSILKIPLSQERIAQKLAENHPERYDGISRLTLDTVDYYCATRQLGIDYLQEYGCCPMLANSKNTDFGCLLQDEIIPLNIYLFHGKNGLCLAEKKRTVSQLVSVVSNLWSSGVSEISFGLDKFGVDKQKNVVLYDLFEMTAVADDIEFLIANKWWMVTNRYLPDKFLHLLNDIFSNEFTIDAFRRNYKNNKWTMKKSKESYIKIIRDYLSQES